MLDNKTNLSPPRRGSLLVQEMRRDDSRYIVAWIGGVLVIYLVMAIVSGI
jgi:hypothetical protein